MSLSDSYFHSFLDFISLLTCIDDYSNSWHGPSHYRSAVHQSGFADHTNNQRIDINTTLQGTGPSIQYRCAFLVTLSLHYYGIWWYLLLTLSYAFSKQCWSTWSSWFNLKKITVLKNSYDDYYFNPIKKYDIITRSNAPHFYSSINSIIIIIHIFISISYCYQALLYCLLKYWSCWLAPSWYVVLFAFACMDSHSYAESSYII